jgi:malonyl CoA-acyl carrier protein transacylase
MQKIQLQTLHCSGNGMDDSQVQTDAWRAGSSYDIAAIDVAAGKLADQIAQPKAGVRGHSQPELVRRS